MFQFLRLGRSSLRQIATVSSFVHHRSPNIFASHGTLIGGESGRQQIRKKSDGPTAGGEYDHIRADVNCPRCSKQMPVLFSNRPLSITGREMGFYQAVNICPSCKTAFYFKPFKLTPLQGSFIEIGRVKGAKDTEGKSEKDGEYCGKGEFTVDNTTTLPKNRDYSSGGFELRRSGNLGKDLGLPTPKQICKALDEFVVGQERAKKV